jgi:hypothetical protein
MTQPILADNQIIELAHRESVLGFFVRELDAKRSFGVVEDVLVVTVAREVQRVLCHVDRSILTPF